jgi:hypothetical protein
MIFSSHPRASPDLNETNSNACLWGSIFKLRMMRVFGAEADQARDGGPPSLHVVSTRKLSLRRDPVNPIPSQGLYCERPLQEDLLGGGAVAGK